MRHRKIGNVMSTDVATVRADMPFKDVVRLLEDRNVGAAPVVDDDGRVVGVVSEADLLVKQGDQEPRPARKRLAWLHHRHDERHAERAEATTAGELMTSPAITVAADATVVDAARVLGEHRVKRLPVVDPDGRLVGIVSRRDLLTVFLRTDEDIREDVVEHVVVLGLEAPPDTVRVTVENGVVSLAGEVETRSRLALAEQMTRHVDGVVDVDVNLTYGRDDTHERTPPAMAVDITHEPWRQ